VLGGNKGPKFDDSGSDNDDDSNAGELVPLRSAEA
jgi:hypothetical protein